MAHRLFAAVLAILLFLPFCSVAAEPRYRPVQPPVLDLVRDGAAQAVVVVPAGAAMEVRHAADELIRYVKTMSGATMQIAGQPGAGPAIVLQVDTTLNPPPAGQRKWTGSRGYRLRVAGNRLSIVGSDALAVLHGAYGLLERHLDVRWLWPGELGEVVPTKKTVTVGALDETSIPDFAVRWVGAGDWALHHGGNAMVKIGKQPTGVNWRWHFHTFDTLIPADKYYDAHPDWWPLVKGQRQKPTQPHSHSTQLCTTNPQMVEELTQNLIAVLDKEPDIEIIALSPNDGGGFCECERCKALDEPQRDWFARYSKRLAVLNNAVAAKVAEKHPHVLVKVGAYAMYLRRPLDAELAPTKNQLVQICHIYCCHNHPLEGDGCIADKTFKPGPEFISNAAFRQIVSDWKKVTDHLFIYEYYTLGGPARASLLWPLVHTIRRDMPYYHRIGAEGFYTQLDDATFHRNGMNYYLAAKLAWNAGLDVDALMADYCQHAFGPAAQPMLDYFRRVDQAMVDADQCLSYGQEQPQRWGPKIFNEKVMREATALVDKALAAAPQGPCQQRVEFVKKGLDEMRDSLAKMVKVKKK
jgi:hypothetical protein